MPNNQRVIRQENSNEQSNTSNNTENGMQQNICTLGVEDYKRLFKTWIANPENLNEFDEDYKERIEKYCEDFDKISKLGTEIAKRKYRKFLLEEKNIRATVPNTIQIQVQSSNGKNLISFKSNIFPVIGCVQPTCIRESDFEIIALTCGEDPIVSYLDLKEYINLYTWLISNSDKYELITEDEYMTIKIK